MFPKKALGALLALLLIGCSKSGERVLGAESAVAPIALVSTLKTATGPVTLAGTMIDKCPTAACWFHLKDASGIVKIDVALAGFTVSEIPDGAALRVFGSYNKDTGAVEATGLRW